MSGNRIYTKNDSPIACLPRSKIKSIHRIITLITRETTYELLSRNITTNQNQDRYKADKIFLLLIISDLVLKPIIVKTKKKRVYTQI